MEYDKLRLDVLESMICSRSIECKMTKNDMIKHLKLDDEGKYIRDTLQEKVKDGFIISIDIKNRSHMNEISRLVEKRDAKSLNRYNNGRINYLSKQKI